MSDQACLACLVILFAGGSVLLETPSSISLASHPAQCRANSTQLLPTENNALLPKVFWDFRREFCEHIASMGRAAPFARLALTLYKSSHN